MPRIKDLVRNPGVFLRDGFFANILPSPSVPAPIAQSLFSPFNSTNHLPQCSDMVFGQEFVGIRRMRTASGLRVVGFGRVFATPRQYDIRRRRMTGQITGQVINIAANGHPTIRGQRMARQLGGRDDFISRLGGTLFRFRKPGCGDPKGRHRQPER